MTDRSLELCMRVRRECTATHLRRASRRLSAAFDEVMAESGLSGPRFSLAVALSLGGEMPLTKLAEALSLDRTTLTRNLAPLEREGLVESRATSDARVRVVRLTPRGRQALERALPLWEAAQRRVVKSLGERRWESLMSTLREL